MKEFKDMSDKEKLEEYYKIPEMYNAFPALTGKINNDYDRLILWRYTIYDYTKELL